MSGGRSTRDDGARAPRSGSAPQRRAHGAQLTLVDGGVRPWYLSERTRKIGNAGVARARDALSRAERPEPRDVRRAG